MSSKILKNKTENIKTSEIFSLMADESANISNTGHLLICSNSDISNS